MSLLYADLVTLADEALMVHLRAGHHDALSVLFHRYHRLVLSVGLRILRDPGEAEDLMQSVFLEIFRSAAQFDPARGTTKVWILQYAYHRGFNRRQYLNIRGFYGSTEDAAIVRDSNTDTTVVERRESARDIQLALGRLNKVQRDIIELAFYEGFSLHEIAQRTGNSYDAVKHQYYRGLEKLRAILCGPSLGRTNTSPEGGVAHARS